MVTIPSIYMVPNVLAAIDPKTHTLVDQAAQLRLENFLNELEWYGNAVAAQREIQNLPVVWDKLPVSATQPAAAKEAVKKGQN